MEEPVLIGKITKTHALKGEVVLSINDAATILNEKTTYLLLARKNTAPVPYFIETLFSHSAGYLVKFENINSPIDAKIITNTDVFVPAGFLEEEIFPENENNESDFNDFMGYTLTDINFGMVGEIKMVLEFPGQFVFSVLHSSGTEVLLPANNNMIAEINREEKKLIYEAPEGLIGIYLEKKDNEKKD